MLIKFQERSWNFAKATFLVNVGTNTKISNSIVNGTKFMYPYFDRLLPLYKIMNTFHYINIFPVISSRATALYLEHRMQFTYKKIFHSKKSSFKTVVVLQLDFFNAISNYLNLTTKYLFNLGISN